MDYESGTRVSITCLNMHVDLINLYFGSKEGYIYIYDRISKNIRLKSEVGKHPIQSIHFISSYTEIMYWEGNHRIGIVNASSLQLSSSIIIDSDYEAIFPVSTSTPTDFLIYGRRKIGSINLKESE